jgi:hypothetical protein
MGPIFVYTKKQLFPSFIERVIDSEPNKDAKQKNLDQHNNSHHEKRSLKIEKTKTAIPQRTRRIKIPGTMTIISHNHAPIRLAMQLTGSVRNQ